MVRNPKSETYNIDCMEYMRTLPDKSVDIIIADPPYGIISDHFGGADKTIRGGAMTEFRKEKSSMRGAGKLRNRVINQMPSPWDNNPPDAEYFKEIFRVSKNQIVWGGNYFPMPPTRCFVCWDKKQPWENFSQVEYAWTSFNRPAKIFRRHNRDKNKIHPTQKPVDLYLYLLERFANEGDTVLDTHLGSGSSRIACYMRGLDFVGCEIDKDYFDKEEERFSAFLQTQGRVADVMAKLNRKDGQAELFEDE